MGCRSCGIGQRQEKHKQAATDIAHTAATGTDLRNSTSIRTPFPSCARPSIAPPRVSVSLGAFLLPPGAFATVVAMKSFRLPVVVFAAFLSLAALAGSLLKPHRNDRMTEENCALIRP